MPSLNNQNFKFEELNLNKRYGELIRYSLFMFMLYRQRYSICCMLRTPHALYYSMSDVNDSELSHVNYETFIAASKAVEKLSYSWSQGVGIWWRSRN